MGSPGTVISIRDPRGRPIVDGTSVPTAEQAETLAWALQSKDRWAYVADQLVQLRSDLSKWEDATLQEPIQELLVRTTSTLHSAMRLQTEARFEVSVEFARLYLELAERTCAFTGAREPILERLEAIALAFGLTLTLA